MDDATHIGRRLREVRSWRGLSIRAAAELAGFTPSYLAQIERGEKPITKRHTLEMIAQALRVAPTELTGLPFTMAEANTSDSHAVLTGVEEALTVCELGEMPPVPVEPRPWEAIMADLKRLTNDLFLAADYAGQGALLPELLYELHALYATKPSRDVLRALMHVYHRATALTKIQGIRGLPTLAAYRAKEVAEELDGPLWTAWASYLHGYAAGSIARARQYALSVRAAEGLSGGLDDVEAQQIYGMLHLNAALAKTALADPSEAATHLDEADAVASRMDAEVGNFAGLFFGRANLHLWRVSLAAELGDHDRVAELASDAHPELIPSASRRATFWSDVGRTLAAERKTRDEGIQALVKAEAEAPQRIRNDLFTRGIVADLLTRARRDAGGRELRGLAWRIGVAPTG